MTRRLYVVPLGRLSYAYALELQRHVATQVISRNIDGDVLLLLEHPPVVTLGRSTKRENLVVSADYLASRGVELFDVERGGDVTFHGPGQLVGYPIIDLKAPPHKMDLHWYLRQIEETLIRALAKVGIRAVRNVGYTGVWVGDSTEPQSREVGADAAETVVPKRKIASIGVHARDWVTWHGFALNVSTDLSYFDLIVPCGIAGVAMTSVNRELAGIATTNVPSFSQHVVDAFADVFDVVPCDGEALDPRLLQLSAN